MSIDFTKPFRFIGKQKTEDTLQYIGLHPARKHTVVLYDSTDNLCKGFTSYNFENIPEEQERYINLYKGVGGSAPHVSRENADESYKVFALRHPEIERIACIKVKYTEGQFDA